jgi:F0F1-type ATP synthase assembly protein I
MSASSMASADWHRPRKLFHAASYLQYLFMAVAFVYVLKPYFNGFRLILENMNFVLLYMGIAIGFSSLQDPTRTQNELSRKVWQDPRKGTWAITMITVMVVLSIGGGLVGLYASGDSPWSMVAMGLITLGLGMFGLLKTAIEMFENHRLDRNSPTRAQVVQEAAE